MIWTVWIFLLDIPLCTFNINAWIYSYGRLDGSNYYPLFGSSFATKTTIITLFYRQLELNLSPQNCLCHYESPSSKLLRNCLIKMFLLFSYKIFCQIKIFPARVYCWTSVNRKSGKCLFRMNLSFLYWFIWINISSGSSSQI